MPVNPAALIEISAFAWVPPFAEGFVRDLRPRWVCEEIGVDYAVRLMDATRRRPAGYLREQPWGQVPVLKDGELEIFESGAILLYLGEKEFGGKHSRLLPVDAPGWARVISWLFAALRRPGVLEFIGGRLDGLSSALGDKPYLAGEFSIADIAMSTVLASSAINALNRGEARSCAGL